VVIDGWNDAAESLNLEQAIDEKAGQQ